MLARDAQKLWYVTKCIVLEKKEVVPYDLLSKLVRSREKARNLFVNNANTLKVRTEEEIHAHRSLYNNSDNVLDLFKCFWYSLNPYVRNNVLGEIGYELFSVAIHLAFFEDTDPLEIKRSINYGNMSEYNLRKPITFQVFCDSIIERIGIFISHNLIEYIFFDRHEILTSIPFLRYVVWNDENGFCSKSFVLTI